MADKPKLPLAFRKNLRDAYESQKSEFEGRLSAATGVPWTLDFDPYVIFEAGKEMGENSYAYRSPGALAKEYASVATRAVEDFAKKTGEEGKDDLNRLASNHSIIISQAEGTIPGRTKCDIHDGCIRILFEKDKLGTNISDSVSKLAEAVNEAGKSQDGPRLSLVARASIRDKFEPEIPKIQAEIAKAGLPNPKVTVDYTDVYVRLRAHYEAPGNHDNYWERGIGDAIKEYFQGLTNAIRKFKDDDMMQEAFQEAVSKNEIVFRVVDKLEKKNYCETVINDGVLYLQTIPEKWRTNVSDVAANIANLL